MCKTYVQSVLNALIYIYVSHCFSVQNLMPFQAAHNDTGVQELPCPDALLPREQTH